MFSIRQGHAWRGLPQHLLEASIILTSVSYSRPAAPTCNSSCACKRDRACHSQHPAKPRINQQVERLHVLRTVEEPDTDETSRNVLICWQMNSVGTWREVAMPTTFADIYT